MEALTQTAQGNAFVIASTRAGFTTLPACVPKFGRDGAAGVRGH